MGRPRTARTEALPGFLWGVTDSSLSAEGVAPTADWSRWERDGRVPTSADGAGFASDHADDLRLTAALGFTDVRITVEWARLEPRPGVVDTDALDRTREVLASAVDAGLRPWVTLVHGTLPGWFADDEQGFAEPASRSSWWARHVDRTAEALEDLAAGWVPIEDPIGSAVRGHLLGTRPPGRTDPEAARAAVEGALEATFEAWRLLQSGDAPVMGVFGAPSVFAAAPEGDAGGGQQVRSQAGQQAMALAREQALHWERVLWDPWLRALTDGEVAWPWRSPVDRPELAGAFDLIGVVGDHPVAVDANGTPGPYPAGARTDATGSAPLPEELGVALRRVHDRLDGRDLVVAGWGVSTTDDDWRDELLRDVVDQVESAMADGVPVVGLFHDALLDGYATAGWGPVPGFAGPRGLVTRDRQLKESGRWLSEHVTGRPPAASLS